jgi:carbamoyltransferase
LRRLVGACCRRAERGEEVDTLREAGCTVSDFSVQAVTDALLAGRIGAVAEGRAEAGPRALGHRSIIALPAPAPVRDRVNALKNREPWRPFAPVTLPSYARRLWPDQGLRARYMVGTAQVSGLAREVLPAAAHVDGSTRPQVVQSGEALAVSRILDSLEAAGAPPVLLNTSFNGRGEPIVDSARDSADAFLKLGLDFLVLALVERGAA